jgi:hypothetical protein
VTWLGKAVDPSTLQPLQITYTARPAFNDGLADPLPQRTVTLDGTPFVPVPKGLEPAGRRKLAKAEQQGNRVNGGSGFRRARGSG